MRGHRLGLAKGTSCRSNVIETEGLPGKVSTWGKRGAYSGAFARGAHTCRL